MACGIFCRWCRRTRACLHARPPFATGWRRAPQGMRYRERAEGERAARVRLFVSTSSRNLLATKHDAAARVALDVRGTARRNPGMLRVGCEEHEHEQEVATRLFRMLAVNEQTVSSVKRDHASYAKLSLLTQQMGLLQQQSQKVVDKVEAKMKQAKQEIEEAGEELSQLARRATTQIPPLKRWARRDWRYRGVRRRRETPVEHAHVESEYRACGRTRYIRLFQAVHPGRAGGSPAGAGAAVHRRGGAQPPLDRAWGTLPGRGWPRALSTITTSKTAARSSLALPTTSGAATRSIWASTCTTTTLPFARSRKGGIDVLTQALLPFTGGGEFDKGTASGVDVPETRRHRCRTSTSRSPRCILAGEDAVSECVSHTVEGGTQSQRGRRGPTPVSWTLSESQRAGRGAAWSAPTNLNYNVSWSLRCSHGRYM